MKDNFSTQAATYARHRPSYPAGLYDFLYAHTPAFNLAWDCATDNGQVARVPADSFNAVEATDISAAQLSNAEAHPRIRYRVAPAEHSSWSGLQHFIRKNGYSPLNDDFRKKMQSIRPDGVLKTVKFPMFGRIGFYTP